MTKPIALTASPINGEKPISSYSCIAHISFVGSPDIVNPWMMSKAELPTLSRSSPMVRVSAPVAKSSNQKAVFSSESDG